MTKYSNDRIVFHIDVNSAYLSWEAVYRLQLGEKKILERFLPLLEEILRLDME